MTFSDGCREAWQTQGRRGEAAACGLRRGVGGGSAGPSGHGATDVDQVVGDDAQADPTLHAVGSFVAGSVQSVTSFQEADPALAPGSPPLGMGDGRLWKGLLKPAKSSKRHSMPLPLWRTGVALT